MVTKIREVDLITFEGGLAAYGHICFLTPNTRKQFLAVEVCREIFLKAGIGNSNGVTPQLTSATSVTED